MEYSMIIMDNSDWSRNGDYIPSRWEAQVDATMLISNSKLALNQESAIGLISLAGKQPQVILTPTNEDLKIQASLYGVKQQGNANFKNALSIGYLALKHRKNTHARQRITVFVASPLEEDESTLVKFAKTLKKNSVAVDLINIGQMDKAHIQKLEKFIETVNQGVNSHFLNIEPGLGRIEDKLLGTPFVGGENPMSAAVGNAGTGDVAINNQFAEWGGVNPQEDPELAEIMRQSLLTNAEEERLRQQREGTGTENNNNKQGEQKMEVEEQKENKGKNDKDLEEELVKRAQEITIDDKKNEDQNKQEGGDGAIKDTAFMNELLDMIPGLNKEDEQIQKALLDKDKDQKKDNDKKDDDEKK